MKPVAALESAAGVADGGVCEGGTADRGGGGANAPVVGMRIKMFNCTGTITETHNTGGKWQCTALMDEWGPVPNAATTRGMTLEWPDHHVHILSAPQPPGPATAVFHPSRCQTGSPLGEHPPSEFQELGEPQVSTNPE